MYNYVTRNEHNIPNPMQWREKGLFSVWNDDQTHKRVKIGERNYKIANLICFHPTRIGNVGNKNNSLVNVRFVAKTSDIRNFSENIRSDVKTSEVATVVKLIVYTFSMTFMWKYFSLVISHFTCWPSLLVFNISCNICVKVLSLMVIRTVLLHISIFGLFLRC